MWHWSRPDGARVAGFLDEQRRLPFTYAAVGATARGVTPPGFVRDHNRVRLGRGATTFAQARRALRAWQMFPAPWTAIEPAAPIEPGQVVAVHVRGFGVWWLSAARIVYVVDEPRRSGFAYGTLPGHAARGEEWFGVEWLDDDSVWFELLAFSRPRYWLARLAYPLTRALQRRFARDAKAAMVRAAA